MERNIKALVTTYIVHPFRLILASATVLFLVLLLFLLDGAFNRLSPSAIEISPHWIYGTIPHLFRVLFSSGLLVSVAAALYFGKVRCAVRSNGRPCSNISAEKTGTSPYSTS